MLHSFILCFFLLFSLLPSSFLLCLILFCSIMLGSILFCSVDSAIYVYAWHKRRTYGAQGRQVDVTCSALKCFKTPIVLLQLPEPCGCDQSIWRPKFVCACHNSVMQRGIGAWSPVHRTRSLHRVRGQLRMAWTRLQVQLPVPADGLHH